MEMGCLYIVATPIGHLADITFRAIDTLKTVDLILAEDTRHAKKLLQHYGISTPTTAYHDHNERNITPSIITRLTEGQHIALISDAGTPLLSDPGFQLVYAAQKANIPVTPIPGPCALVSALSASGLATDAFYFAGFIPAKPEQRKRFLTDFATHPETVIFYESTHRLLKSLHAAAECFGETRLACLAKELTKTHETLRTDTLTNIIAWLNDDPVRQKGEFVLLVAGDKTDKRSDDSVKVNVDHLLRALMGHMSHKDAANLTATITQGKKNTYYKRALALNNQAKTAAPDSSNRS